MKHSAKMHFHMFDLFCVLDYKNIKDRKKNVTYCDPF